METISKTYSETSNFSLIFLHGFPLDHRMWIHQMGLKGVNTVALDLQGAGKKKDDTIFSMESMVDTAFSEIYSLGWKNPILCGLSMGGYVALRMLEKYPDFFKGAILFDTRSEADSNEGKLTRAQNIKLLLDSGLDGFVENFVQKTVAPKAFEKNPEMKTELLSIAKSQKVEGIASQVLAMQGRTDTTAFLSQIKIPVLVICGEEDGITPPEGMKNFASKIPGSEFHLIPNAGHMTPYEKPEIVNKIINEFIKKLEK